jgi:nucleoside-diphosphate-sugar epimerase
MDMTRTGVRILVTGATGFLGAHLVRALVGGGHDVTATYRPQADRWRLADVTDRVRWMSMDLADSSSIRQVVQQGRPHTVVHCAAYGMNYAEQSFEEGVRINICATRILFQEAAAAGTRRFIHSGSCFEYGNKSVPVTEDEVLEPISMYGVTKATATLLVLQLSRALGMPAAVVRPFGIYGPADRGDKFVPQLIRSCLSKRPIALSGGAQIRDYTFVKDAVDLYVRLAESEAFPSGQIINLAGGRPVTLKHIGEIVARLTRNQQSLQWGALPYRPDEVMTLTAQTEKAKRLLGWAPNIDLEEGLEETIRWHRRQEDSKPLDCCQA